MKWCMLESSEVDHNEAVIKFMNRLSVRVLVPSRWLATHAVEMNARQMSPPGTRAYRF
jgi:hypothetical protein